METPLTEKLPTTERFAMRTCGCGPLLDDRHPLHLRLVASG
jgi:hypothetical protein